MNRFGKTPTMAIRPGRAARLISRLVASGTVSAESIAQGLHITMDTLDRYISGRDAMPLNVQARVSLYVLANFPTFMRPANQLRSQVAAAIDYQTRTMK
jgi:hypothetical protein